MSKMKYLLFTLCSLLYFEKATSMEVQLKPSYYSAETNTYFNPYAKKKDGPSMSFWETIKVVNEVFFNKSSRSPKTKMPEIKPDLAEFLKPSDATKFIWFGHSTLLLNIDGKTVLIDPVFSNYAFAIDILVKRFQPPVLKLEELPPIDYVVISHDHYDHLDKKSVLFFKDKKARFLVPTGVGEILKDWGISADRFTERNWHESVNESGITFTATPAQHFSGRGLFDRNKTLWASWIIQGQNDKIYFSGDSGYGPHFKEIGEKYGPFDLAFIENGQYNERWSDIHMLPEDTLQAHLDLNAHYMVPIHWGMFDLSLHNWSEPVERTYKIATNWHIPYISPKIGQIIHLGEKIETKPWWTEVGVKAPELVLTPKTLEL